MIDSTEKTVSPLDCISYVKQLTSEEPWLFNGNKSVFISLAAVSCCISLLFGLAIGIFMSKTNQIFESNDNRKINTCINEVLKESFHVDSMM